MSESPASNFKNPPKRRRRRWRLLILLLFVLLLAGPLVYVLYCNHLHAEQLQAVIDELDETDPKWRLKDIEASRPPLPDDQNAALQVAVAHRNMPNVWGYDVKRIGGDSFEDPSVVPAPVQLNAKQVAFVRGELEKAKVALTEARKLKDYKTGHYKMVWNLDGTSRDMQKLSDARNVETLLFYDVLLQAHEQKHDNAWKSALAIFGISKSIGNVDDIILLLCRIGVRSRSLDAMQRVLGQGQVSGDMLASAQQMLEDDLTKPILWSAVRGERAGKHRLYSAIRSGELSIQIAVGPDNPFVLQIMSWRQTGDSYLNYGMITAAHSWTLKFTTRFAKASKLPPQKLVNKIDEFGAEYFAERRANTFPVLAVMVVPALTKVAQADISRQIHTRCTIVGIACERFRLKHNRWPNGLEELIEEKLMSKIPIDPYSNKALLYKRHKYGIAIFSKGISATEGYEGQLIDDPYHEGLPFPFMAFHLWNVDRRRQLPLPP